MAHVYDFRPRAVTYETYSDGSLVPHLEILVYKDLNYWGYVEIHCHKLGDESVSVGVTVRGPTERKP